MALTILGATTSSYLSITFIIVLGLILPLPADKYISSNELSLKFSHIFLTFSSLINSDIDNFLFLNSFSKLYLPRSI